ncbi:hypothetical protein G6L28_16010 [Agrobacterium larrymoorei]|uniref:hypothetical protein n=1 Tax=Agrobacterium larrymoorei TaxID=160699 RepID=UPI001574520A|nr:hypothetical protein [Agrobacterium larrymoorei]NTJ44105.1 hypothetical protein [Agrobacterium larrymoorei]
MGKSHPIALLEGVIAFVEKAITIGMVARRFRMSPGFMNDLVIVQCRGSSIHFPIRSEPFTPPKGFSADALYEVLVA